MLFNSFFFILLFLPITLFLFFTFASYNKAWAAFFLAFASIIFYSCWDIRFVPVLLGSISWNYTCSIIIKIWKSRNKPKMVRAVLIIAIAGNLALLGYFKYADFFVNTINQLFGREPGQLSIILPLGISFFTFTQIAFLVDTARGEVNDFNLVRYILFVTYFPHLIAGPILHHKEMMPQFSEPSTYFYNTRNVAIGTIYFCVGLTKKCLLADGFSSDASHAFVNAAHGQNLTAPSAWQGVLAYTLQIYFDFSGYIDMAIGISLMFNIRLPLNFNSPYKSSNIIEFWRRWHMTLSRFLRDYVYIPLGGNRLGSTRRYANLLITMIIGGFWHGANWTFLIWGGLHGFYLIINHAWRAMAGQLRIASIPGILYRMASISVTFLSVMIAWVFFRASDIPAAFAVLKGMVGLNGFAVDYTVNPYAYSDFDLFLNWFGFPLTDIWKLSAALYAAAVFIIFFMPNNQELIEPELFRRDAARKSLLVRFFQPPSIVWGALCGLAIIASMLTFTRVSEFLYFRF